MAKRLYLGHCGGRASKLPDSLGGYCDRTSTPMHLILHLLELRSPLFILTHLPAASQAPMSNNYAKSDCPDKERDREYKWVLVTHFASVNGIGHHDKTDHKSHVEQYCQPHSEAPHLETQHGVFFKGVVMEAMVTLALLKGYDGRHHRGQTIPPPVHWRTINAVADSQYY